MAKSTGPLAFLKDHQAPGSLHGSNACFGIKRKEGAQVNHFHFDVFRCQKVRCLEGDVNHGSPRHQRDIATASNHLGTADFVALTPLNVGVHRLRVNGLVDVHAPARQSATQTVEANVFQHENRVGQLSPFHQQVIGVLGCAWRHHHQTWVVGKPGFDHVRMERPRTGASAKRNADRHGTVCSPAPTKHGRVVHQGVESEGCEATKLNFDHGLHA